MQAYYSAENAYQGTIKMQSYSIAENAYQGSSQNCVGESSIECLLNHKISGKHWFMDLNRASDILGV